MTLLLPPDPDRAAVLRAIDAQLRPTPEERAELIRATDAQHATQTMLRLRDDIEITWGKR